MEKILKSRTIWTIVLVASIGAWQALNPFVEPATYAVINSTLLALAAYFKISPSQNYDK